MSIGLGKRYWVRLVKYHYGDLDSCIKFMQENPPSNEHYWYELRPVPKIVKGHVVSCVEYSCNLLEDGK